MSKYLTYDGLQTAVALIKSKFVQVDGNKVLSDQNFSNEDKNKLDSLMNYELASNTANGLMSSTDKKKISDIETGAEKNAIVQVKRNGSIISPDGNRAINLSVPVKLSELTNDRQYQTKADVQSLIQNAGKMTKEIVASLPTTGKDNVIYLKGPTGSGNNIFEEYLWINAKWEKIGDTATTVDLSGYVKKTDLKTITNAEINSLFGA